MKSLLLNIARNAIEERLNGTPLIDRSALIQNHKELLQQRATFVTLHLNGQLRGCIGSLIPHRSLIDDIIANAQAAAFEDPRFVPLSMEEFESIEIELSLLSIPQALNYKDLSELKEKIEPKRHGVILNYQGHQATFLPQVWEEIGLFENFFAQLCLKAGLDANCLSHHPDIYTYEVEKLS